MQRVTSVGNAIQILLDGEDLAEIAAVLYWTDWKAFPKARELFGRLDEVAEVSL